MNLITRQRRMNILTALFITCAYLCTITQAEQEKHCDTGQCKKGQYLDLELGCTECPSGFYMDEDNNACLECHPCTNALPDLGEVVKKECTATSDTVLGCAVDHYSTVDVMEPQRVLCQKCKVCEANEVTQKKCDDLSDTICCPHSGMKIIETLDGHWKCDNDDDDNQQGETQQERKPDPKYPSEKNDSPFPNKLIDIIPPFITIGILFFCGLYVCIHSVCKYRHTCRHCC